MNKTEIGKVRLFFKNINVAVIDLTADLKLGEDIIIGDDVEMKVTSMQIEKTPIEKAKAGQAIGMKTTQEVKPGDVVYKVTG